MNRNTRQRRALRDVFEENDRPLGPYELLNLASAKAEGLGIATVYRTIKSLLEGGIIAQVDLPGEPPRYEAAGKAPHHHFQCEHCNKVFDIEGQLRSVQELVPQGFSVSDHSLMLYGECSECSGQENSASLAALASVVNEQDRKTSQALPLMLELER